MNAESIDKFYHGANDLNLVGGHTWKGCYFYNCDIAIGVDCEFMDCMFDGCTIRYNGGADFYRCTTRTTRGDRN